MAKIYNNNNMYESEEIEDTITVDITMEDGTEVECEVLSVFPVDGRQYVALLPLKEGMEDIFLYRYIPQGEDEFELDDIETDEEYDAVADMFDMILDDAEFDALDGDDE